MDLGTLVRKVTSKIHTTSLVVGAIIGGLGVAYGPHAIHYANQTFDKMFSQKWVITDIVLVNYNSSGKITSFDVYTDNPLPNAPDNKEHIDADNPRFASLLEEQVYLQNSKK